MIRAKKGRGERRKSTVFLYFLEGDGAGDAERHKHHLLIWIYFHLRGHCTQHQLIAKVVLLSYRHDCAPCFWGDKPDPNAHTLAIISFVHTDSMLWNSPQWNPCFTKYTSKSSMILFWDLLPVTFLHLQADQSPQSLHREQELVINTMITVETHELLVKYCHILYNTWTNAKWLLYEWMGWYLHLKKLHMVQEHWQWWSCSNCVSSPAHLRWLVSHSMYNNSWESKQALTWYNQQLTFILPWYLPQW